MRERDPGTEERTGSDGSSHEDAPCPCREEAGSKGRTENAPASPDRRRLLSLLALGLGGAGAVAVGVPFAGFLLAPLDAEDEAWRSVARVDDLAVGETIKVSFLDPAPVPWAGFAARSAAWLRRESDEEFVAFSLYCTHTGCPLMWEEGAQLFLCPCHGGAFYRDGRVASGPPPVPMYRHPIRIRGERVELRTIGLRVPGG